MSRALGQLRSGHNGVLFFSGEAGAGKTTLLEEARWLADADIRVAWAQGRAMEAEIPYGLASQAFESLGRPSLTEPPGPGVAPSDMRLVVLDRARTWLYEEALDRPLLLLLDDLHWSDPDSLALVAFVVRRLGTHPVGIIGALRPWPPQLLVETLVRDGQGELVSLEPLTRDAVQDLLTELLDAPPGEALVTSAYALTGGNPFLVCQFAGALASTDHLPDLEPLDMGHFRHDLLLSSWVTLPEPAIECGRAAAVLGDHFRMALVARVAGMTDEVAAGGLEVLFRAGLVREAENGWATFAHLLVRNAVYEELSPARRRVLHARAFECLADLGESSTAASHAIAADLVGQARAIEIVRIAANAALGAGAVQSGIEHLQAAIRLAGGMAPASLHADLGDALMAAGQPQDAAAAYRKALADSATTGTNRVRALQLLARALAYSGDLDGSGRVSAEAMAMAENASPESVAAALVDHVHVVWQIDGPGRAFELLSQVERLEIYARADPTLEAARCFVRFCAEPDESVVPTLAALVEESEGGQGSTQSSPFDPLLVYMSVARYLERFDEDDRVYELAYARATESGVRHALVPLQVSRADNYIRRGRPLEALAVLDEAQRNAVVEPMMEQAVALGQAAALAELGRFVEAEDRVPALGSGSFMWMVRLSSAALESRLTLARGRVDEACDGYLAVRAMVEELGLNAPMAGVNWVGHAMDAFLTGRRLVDAAHLCDWLDFGNARLSCQSTRMVALSGRAAIAAAAGDHQEADEMYARAVELPAPLPLEHARVLLRYGEWLRRSNRPVRARPLIADALAIAEKAGATDLAARARAELQVAGGRRHPRRAGNAELTTQECRVAALTSRGLSTREVAERLHVSPRTVESHLMHIYDKLGVPGRRALRDRMFDVPD